MIFRCLYGQSTTIPIFRSPNPTALRLLQSPRQSAALQGICHQQLLLRSNMAIPGKSLNSMEVSSLDNPLWWPLPRLTAGGYTAIKWFAYLHKIVGFSLYGWFLGSIPCEVSSISRGRTSEYKINTSNPQEDFKKCMAIQNVPRVAKNLYMKAINQSVCPVLCCISAIKLIHGH